MQSTFRFSSVEILVVPTASFIYNFLRLGTIDHIFWKKKGLDVTSGKTYLWGVSIGTRAEA